MSEINPNPNWSFKESADGSGDDMLLRKDNRFAILLKRAQPLFVDENRGGGIWARLLSEELSHGSMEATRGTPWLLADAWALTEKVDAEFPVRTDKTKEVYQFLYGTVPPPGAPISIDSSEGDADDEFVQNAVKVSGWIPMGVSTFFEERPTPRGPMVIPVEKMVWRRTLVVPAAQVKRGRPLEEPQEAPQAPSSPILRVTPGTTVADIERATRRS